MRRREKSPGKFPQVTGGAGEAPANFQESQMYHIKNLSKLQENFNSSNKSTKKSFLLKSGGV
jgi:hypothetical protein